jgi:hypothetical protein
MAEFGIPNKGAPADVVGAVVAWLATSPEADVYKGTNIEAQFVCADRELVPGWPGPELHQNNIRYDESGTVLGRLEGALAPS